jgi:hypothetical protein
MAYRQLQVQKELPSVFQHFHPHGGEIVTGGGEGRDCLFRGNPI